MSAPEIRFRAGDVLKGFDGDALGVILECGDGWVDIAWKPASEGEAIDVASHPTRLALFALDVVRNER